MYIGKMNARKVFVGPCGASVVAEASVELNDGSVVYVTIQDYEGTEYTVSKESVYEFLVGNRKNPAKKFDEEYLKWADAKVSAYAGVFEKLKKAMKMLG